MSLDENCIFCKILRGEIPSDKVYEDGDVLCVPKSHFSYLSEMGEKERGLVGKCMAKLPEIARLAGIEKGYRVIINQGEDAGQTVFHLHIHILGGQNMGENLL